MSILMSALRTIYQLSYKKFKFCSKVVKIGDPKPLRVYLCALIMTFQNICQH